MSLQCQKIEVKKLPFYASDITNFTSAVCAVVTEMSSFGEPIFETWAYTYSADLYSSFTTVNTYSSIWQQTDDTNVNSFVYSNSANILQSNSIVNTTSGNWNSVYNSYNTASSSFLTNNSADIRYVNISGDVMTGGLSSPSLSTNNLYVAGSTINFFDGNGNIIETLKSNDVTNFKSNYNVTNSHSANWDDVYSDFSSQSANNNSVYNIVNSNSSTTWNYQGNDLKSLSGNWEDTYNTVQDYSAAWIIDNSIDFGVRSLTSNWESTYNTVESYSAAWIVDNSIDSGVRALTSNWQNTYVNFSSQSANNISVYNSFNSNSSNYDSVYNTVNTNSGINWNYQGLDIKALTGNWQNTYISFSSQSANNISVYNSFNSNSSNYDSVYNIVNTNSATNWNYQGTDIKSLTSNWQNTYSTVSSYSASWVNDVPQTLTFNNINAELTISNGNTVSLSALSGGGSSGVSYLSALNDVYIPSPANGQVLVYSSVLQKWTTGSPASASGQTGYYGSFYDTTAQTLTGVNQAKRLDIADTFEANGVSLSSNKIVFNNIGTYEIIFSIQYKNTSSTQEDIYVWFRKNGVDIPDSSSVFTIPARKNESIPAHLIAVTPFIATLAASDFIEIYWHCGNTEVTVETFTTHTNPTIPDTPGVIITVKQVTNVQLVPTVGAYLPLSGGTVTGVLSTTNVIYASGGNSDQWNSSYNTVNSYSATTWNYQGTDIKALTGNWQNTYINFSIQSANNISVYNSFNSNSSNYNSVYNTVQSNSSTTWNYQGTDLKSLSSNWENTYNTVQSNSALWGTGGGVAQTLSFNESNAELSISSGNTVSLSSLSGGGNGGNGVNIAGNLAYNRWQFTGVPPVSIFNITGATSEIEESYRVTIDAVIQDPVNFNVVADTITFSQVPPLSSNIVIIEQYNTSLTAIVSSFTTPVTASGDFIILRVNNVDRAIRLWDF